VLTEPAWEDHFTLLSALRTDAAATAVALVPRKGEVKLLAIGDAYGDMLLATTAGVVLAEWPSGTFTVTNDSQSIKRATMHSYHVYRAI